MNAEVRIRPCVAADLSAVQEIYAHEVETGTATFEMVAPERAEIEGRWRGVVALGLPWLVAEKAGTVLGYAYAGAYRPRPAYRFTGETSIYVASEARGRGIGTDLMATLIAESETAGLRQLVAIIGDSSNTASIRLHERAGFAHVGTLKDVGYKFDRWLDTVIMQLTLG